MGKTIGVGCESRGLHHLVVPSSPVVSMMMDPLDLIHNCLRHPSLSKLQKIVPHLSSLHFLDCKSCQKGKHTRASFPSRVRADAPFSLVHSNV